MRFARFARLGRLVRASVAALSLGCARDDVADAPLDGERSTPPEGLHLRSQAIQPLPPPPDLPRARVMLGKRLFHDKRLSATGDVACGSCHDVAHGGADTMAHSQGVNGGLSVVNAPSVLNSVYSFRLTWDGHARTLEDVVDAPLTNPVLMGSSWPRALGEIAKDPSYVTAFGELFPDGISPANVRTALATYERALVTPSRFDRWLSGQADAITREEQDGYELFQSVGCIACHQGRNVGGNMFQRFGVMGDYFKDRGNIEKADFGRYNVTKNEADRFTFRVPSLRNVEDTGPYFHDGTRATLRDAIRTMAKYQLGRQLSEHDVLSLEVFLRSLTGRTREELWPDVPSRAPFG